MDLYCHHFDPDRLDPPDRAIGKWYFGSIRAILHADQFQVCCHDLHPVLVYAWHRSHLRCHCIDNRSYAKEEVDDSKNLQTTHQFFEFLNRKLSGYGKEVFPERIQRYYCILRK